MSYAALNQLVVDRLQGLPSIAVVLNYEPTTIVDYPTCYVLLDRVELNDTVGGSERIYTLIARVLFRWVDNEQAEIELMPLVDALPGVIDGATSGWDEIRVKEISAVFVSIGGVMYRALDCYVTAKETDC